MKTLTKAYTKNNTIKTKQGYISFDDYRTALINKRNKTYFGDTDIILDVVPSPTGSVSWPEYVVKDEKTGRVRTHGTFIKLEEVY